MSTRQKKNHALAAVQLCFLANVSLAEAQRDRESPPHRLPGCKHCFLAARSYVDGVPARAEQTSDGLRERISPSSTGLPSKSLSACLSLRRTWFVLRLI